MSWNSTTCPKHGTYDFYGRYVPPCPTCGWPELKTSEEYYRAMGILPRTVVQSNHHQQGANHGIHESRA